MLADVLLLDDGGHPESYAAVTEAAVDAGLLDEIDKWQLNLSEDRKRLGIYVGAARAAVKKKLVRP